MLHFLPLQSAAILFFIVRSTVLFSLLITASFSFAQTGIITGRVNTEEGVSSGFVNIKLDDAAHITTSDINGYYKIENVSPGKHSLKVLIADSVVLQKDITMLNDAMVVANFQLHHLTRHQLNEIMVEDVNPYAARKPSESLRLNVDLLEVPQSIQTTNQRSIQEQGFITTTDILKAAAGSLSFNSAGQDVGVMIRGSMSSNSILRNGIGAGYFYNQELDAAMIEKVEFIMGPAGFMISNTDPGGLVNIVTKQPLHSRKLAITAAYGSWNMVRTSIDIGGEFKKKSPFTYRFNTGIQHQHQPYKFGYLTKYFMAAALKYEMNTNNDITFEYNYAHGKSLNDQQFLPTINGRFFEVPNDFNITDPNLKGIATYDHYFRLNFNHRFNDVWSLNVQLGNTFGAWRANSMAINTDASVTNDTIYRYMYKDNYLNHLYTATAFLKGAFNMGQHFNHFILTGLDMGSSKINDTYDQQYGRQLALYYPNPVYLPKSAVVFNFVDPYTFSQSNRYHAFYVQDHIKCYNKFIITLAARFTHSLSFNSNNSDQQQRDLKLTPRIGFTYLWNRNMSIYILYDQSFMPQVGKRFDGTSFAPLTGNNIEMGWKCFWLKQRLSLSLTLYQTTRNNMLTADLEHQGFKTTMGQMVTKGLEININGKLTRNFNIAANYAYIDARVTQSNNSMQPAGIYNFASPKHNTANVFLNYTCWQGVCKGLSIGTSVQHVDKFNSSRTSNSFIGGYTLLNAFAAYSFGKFNINLNVFNIANTKYITYGFQYNQTDYIYTPGQPINFRLGIGFEL